MSKQTLSVALRDIDRRLRAKAQYFTTHKLKRALYEDVYQEMRIAAWRAYEEYREGNIPLEAYMLTRATYAGYHLARVELVGKRVGARHSVSWESWHDPGTDDDTSDVLLRNLLVRAQHEMKPRITEIALKHYVLGHDIADIAQELGISRQRAFVLKDDFIKHMREKLTHNATS